jgi:hypothetical protein
MTRQYIIKNLAIYAPLNWFSSLTDYQLVELTLDFQANVIAGLSPQDAIWISVPN